MGVYSRLPGLRAGFFRSLAAAAWWCSLQEILANKVDEVPVACGCSSDAKHWERFRQSAVLVFTPDLPKRMLNTRDPVFWWLRNFPCPHLPAGESWMRGGTAISDCTAGVLMMHVACAQRRFLELDFQGGQDHMIETLQVLPFAEQCLEDAPIARRWPLSALDVHTNYVRVYRALSYYEKVPALVLDLAWRPSKTCFSDSDCSHLQGAHCKDSRCTSDVDDCDLLDQACPAGEVCTEVNSPSGSDCALSMNPLCVVNGELEAYRPRSSCKLHTQQQMVKACSEMGTTLYPLSWTTNPYSERLRQHTELHKRGAGEKAFILPVTLRLHSPWHMLHSLIPAYAQVILDSRYGLSGGTALDILLVDQDLDKDRHIWQNILGDQTTGIGPLSFLLELLSQRPFELLADIHGPRCYKHVIWGHELMLYSGGGWVDHKHVLAFIQAGKALVLGAKSTPLLGSHCLLIERRNATAWGRWIDNFGEVFAVAKEWAAEHPHLLSRVHTADLADLAVRDQLAVVGSMRIVFGAHGDGLSWATFMREGSAVLEAIPFRGKGFQACVEGINENPYGIFGGLARLARQIHACWVNAESKIRPGYKSDGDEWQWGWRQMNMHIDLKQFRFYLAAVADMIHKQ